MGYIVVRTGQSPEDTHQAWFIESFAGSMERAWDILPFELPEIGFQRFDNNPRFYPIDTLRRMTIPTHEMASTASPA